MCEKRYLLGGGGGGGQLGHFTWAPAVADLGIYKGGFQFRRWKYILT